MCGINGFVKLGSRNGYPKEKMQMLVHNMNETIIHRGPDSEGIYADAHCSLGMRRLSIIDLDTGSQPIFSTDHSKLIVFNGEIYNYRVLREELVKEGCCFYTKSDTEVVLQGLMKYGKDYVKRLEGMFAFCYYDVTNRRYILARDKVGEKPLYYYQTRDFFLFGSELKSLLGTGLISKEIDSDALTTYFQLAFIPAPMCIIKGIRKLMPATVVEIDGKSGKTSEESYWYLKVHDDPKYCDYTWCRRQLREQLLHSVEQRMIADVPIGAFLSGGFDSSIIVGIMSRLASKPIDTFTIGFQEKAYDESGLAKIVAKRNGTNHHTIMLDWDEAEKNLNELLDNMDEPFADSSLIATYVISKKTKDYVTVALTGDASDELFAGYNKYLMGHYGSIYRKVPGLFRHGIIEPIVHHLPRSSTLYRKANKVVENANLPITQQTKRLMSRSFRQCEVEQLIPGVPCNPLNFIEENFAGLNMAGEHEKYHTVDEQKRLQYVDFHTVLEGQMLPKVDRASMKASLETRVPMLDTNVIELAFSMPSEFKIKGTKRKIILKDTFKDLLPNELFTAPKHGFDVPVGAWLNGSLKNELKKYRSREFIERQGIFQKELIDEIVAENDTENLSWSAKVWTFFVFQRWYECYVA